MRRVTWFSTWDPMLSNGIGRLEFLMVLRAAVVIARSRTTRRIDHSSINVVIDKGVLNAGQIGNLLNVTPQQVRNIGRDRGIKSAAPRGLFDAYDLDLLFLTVQRLSLHEPPMEWMLESLPYAGDPAIVSYLTGVPMHVINKYRKLKEAADATDHSERVAPESRLLEGDYSAAR